MRMKLYKYVIETIQKFDFNCILECKCKIFKILNFVWQLSIDMIKSHNVRSYLYKIKLYNVKSQRRNWINNL